MIRPYTKADRAQCIDVFNSNLPKYFAAAELNDFGNWLTGKDEGRNSYRNNICEKFYVTETDNRILACGGFYVPADEHRANLVWGMVHASFHKRNLGQELLAYRLAEIKETFPGFPVTIDTTQHTYEFFQKMHFHVTDIQKDHYGEGLDRYDMILDSRF